MTDWKQPHEFDFQEIDPNRSIGLCKCGLPASSPLHVEQKKERSALESIEAAAYILARAAHETNAGEIEIKLTGLKYKGQPIGSFVISAKSLDD